jgi:radical SAM superfamily enzyme YgiQ (UPF0313 family)
MADLRRDGFRKFHFVDNTFNLPLDYAKQLCRELIAAQLDLDWWAIVYPKWVDAELVDLMARAGCTLVSLGFESGSEPILTQLNKQFHPAEVRAISGLFRAAGIQRYGFLLLGAPHETQSTVEEPGVCRQPPPRQSEDFGRNTHLSQHTAGRHRRRRRIFATR